VSSSGGVAAGGPFALSHGPPGASTGHLLGMSGGGSGHFSSVSALRAKKQPSAQPQGGSAIMVSLLCSVSYRFSQSVHVCECMVERASALAA
jgi:hypothetical protein